MKHQTDLWRTFAIPLVLAGIVWRLIEFAGSRDGRLTALGRDVALMTVLFCLAGVLFGQNPDDDDWAGQY